MAETTSLQLCGPTRLQTFCLFVAHEDRVLRKLRIEKGGMGRLTNAAEHFLDFGLKGFHWIVGSQFDSLGSDAAKERRFAQMDSF